MSYPTSYNRGVVTRDPFFGSVFDRFFNDSAGTGVSTSVTRGRVSPSVDVLESDESYKLLVDLPGVLKENVSVEVKENVLSITAKHESNAASQDDNDGYRVVRSERRRADYERRFTLGDTLDAENISAKFENGVLTVTVPRQAEPQEVSRSVTVN